MKTTVTNPQNKREEKKQINIVWNSRLYFQIGTIISSLLVFFLMQTSFKTTAPFNKQPSDLGLMEPPVFSYQLDIDKPKPVVSVNKEPVKKIAVPQKVQAAVFEVAHNIVNVVETSIPANDAPVIESPILQAPTAKVPEKTAPTSIINVEFVPVYPGCEGLATNAEKIECLSSKITIYINRNFRSDLFKDLEQNEIHRIYVQFKIDSQGFIKNVQAISNNERLKTEAQRVVSTLPRMKPGKQGDKNVEVIYTVPIVFQIK